MGRRRDLRLGSPPNGAPGATIDIATDAGVQMVKGQWRYHDTKIVETGFRAPGPDGQPTGAPVQTYDYAPHAGGANFDDASWDTIGATTLEQRRGNGRLGFNWYRIGITIPDRIDGFDPSGSTPCLKPPSTTTPRSGWTANSRAPWAKAVDPSSAAGMPGIAW